MQSLFAVFRSTTFLAARIPEEFECVRIRASYRPRLRRATAATHIVAHWADRPEGQLNYRFLERGFDFRASDRC